MQVFEKIKYNLMILAEETYYKSVDGDTNAGERNSAYHKAIKIVDQVAEEYNNGWIPCSERLPEEHESIFAKFKGTSNWHKGMFEKTSDDVNVTIEYEDGQRATKTMHTIDGKWKIQGCVKYKVIAWQPLPEPFQQKGD